MQSGHSFFWGGYDEGQLLGFPQDWYTLDSRVILLKGGPGTGKSTLMKRLATRWIQEGRDIRCFHCAADPSSLDAVCTADRSLCVLDATPPHAVEPRFPGAVEQLVNLGEGLSREKLRPHLPELTRLAGDQQALRLRAGQYLRAAAVLKRQSNRSPDNRPSDTALWRCASRLFRQTLAGESTEGGEQRAFLSGITPDGFLTLDGTLTGLCPRLYVLEEDEGLASRLLTLLRQRAALEGIPAIVCPCALCPEETEHLLFPAAGTAFTTAGSFHPVDYPVYRRLSMHRYREKPLTDSLRRQWELSVRTREEMLTEAAALLSRARELHRQEELLYGEAMDWERVDVLSEQVLHQLG